MPSGASRLRHTAFWRRRRRLGPTASANGARRERFSSRAGSGPRSRGVEPRPVRPPNQRDRPARRDSPARGTIARVRVRRPSSWSAPSDGSSDKAPCGSTTTSRPANSPSILDSISADGRYGASHGVALLYRLGNDFEGTAVQSRDQFLLGWTRNHDRLPRAAQRSGGGKAWNDRDNGVSNELELAAQAMQQLEPAVEEFAEATGLLEPVRQLTTWLAEIIYYRRAPHKARLLMNAAKKIKETGLPTSAVSDRLLRAVLEDGALEDDPGMQERWSNLLAHEATGGEVPPSFIEILRQLEPEEARWLDEHVPDFRGPRDEIDLRERQVDNLQRLGLVHMRVSSRRQIVRRRSSSSSVRSDLEVTQLATDFVDACRWHRAPETVVADSTAL